LPNQSQPMEVRSKGKSSQVVTAPDKPRNSKAQDLGLLTVDPFIPANQSIGKEDDIARKGGKKRRSNRRRKAFTIVEGTIGSES
jgi:hypothetical protein